MKCKVVEIAKFANGVTYDNSLTSIQRRVLLAWAASSPAFVLNFNFLSNKLNIDKLLLLSELEKLVEEGIVESNNESGDYYLHLGDWQLTTKAAARFLNQKDFAELY